MVSIKKENLPEVALKGLYGKGVIL